MLLERSAQLSALQADIIRMKEKKRRYKAALAEAKSRIHELEARLSHVPSPRSSIQLNFSSGMMNLLELDDSPALGLPAIEQDISPLPIQEEIASPNNEDFYLYASREKQGIVYQDTVLEVAFSIETVEYQGTLLLSFKNLSANSITNLQLAYRSDEDHLGLVLQSQAPSSVLEPATSYTSELGLTCKSPFSDPPLVLISYKLRSTSVSLVLKLPISVVRFIHPCAETVPEAKSLWLALKGNSDKVEFPGLRSDIRSLRAVTEVMACAGALHTFSPRETGIERTIIATGKGFGSPLIIRLSINSSADQVELHCLCADSALRAFVLALLRAQLQPNASA